MKTAQEFFIEDFQKALFPLDTNRFLITKGVPQISAYLSKVLDENEKSISFLAQTRVYAAKPHLHLRRTVKLDAVAEYFLYDLIYRNKAKFRKPHSATHRHFGYRFHDGEPISPTESYRGYKGAISAAQKKYKHSISFDVASYFNSLYHHDLVAWMANIDASTEDYNSFGQFLREINSGRSIDCLPQGLYPAKMIGNDFLRFIDNHHALKCSESIRFMDDIVIFDNDEELLKRDFLYIQRILGDKGLSVNPHKTQRDAHSAVKFESDLDEIKQKLLKRRRFMITVGYDDENNAIQKQSVYKAK
ncbi:MAG: RNA-directed DNA polymerase [Devosia sp.]|nr:RNA-directed DNA polymerase [Devosia sp.]